MHIRLAVILLLKISSQCTASVLQNDVCKWGRCNSNLKSTAETSSEGDVVLLQQRMDKTALKHAPLRIPKIVFFTGNWDPDEIVKKSKAMVEPGTEFRYFSLPQMQASVAKVSKILERETGTHGAWEAFNALRPIAYRVDLWRAMVLWESGGVYADAKIKLTRPLGTWVDDRADLSLCHDIDLDYWNAMFSAPRRSPMLLAIIRKIIDNVSKRLYPDQGFHSDLFVAGPGAYSDALRNYDEGGGGEPHCVCQLQSGGTITSNGAVIGMVDEGLHQAMRNCKTCNDYSELYKSHQVYCDEDGPPCNTDHNELGLLQEGGETSGAEYWSQIVW
eukprot:gnl/MRDRNA2_/MRDRNA2_88831_c0_seq1.p1 gnl/MRDRNA2_/MRDRNA2_88831_c0~~gnl/MRDRNA2_/MRDRNA2_88831_c0_seq1.p1  ORF type:complete len:331 (-),score=45.31 gnl/MRDRNA2_/MRDRNA2_88831_c0_seq1:5-997(-)